MATAILGAGTLFQWGDGNSPEIFTSFQEVISVSPPKAKIDSIDVSHELPPGSTREGFAGMIDWGETSITFNFVPGNLSALQLIAETNSMAIINRKIVYPNGTTCTFPAFLTSWDTTEAVGDRLAGSATFKVTADPIFT